MYDLPSLHSIASRLSFRHLNLLIVLNETGSLHKAAAQLGITQPGLSRALQEVEDTFGGQLFNRSAKGVVANVIGQTVVTYAINSRHELLRLRNRLDATLQGNGGYLAIGAMTGALHGLVINAVNDLLKMEASIFTIIREGTSIELLEFLERGVIDLAVCRVSMSLSPGKFNFEPLFNENLSIVVSKDHPLADSLDPTWTELHKFRWILFPSNLPIYSVLEQQFRHFGLAMPPSRIETSSPFVTLLMLKQFKAAVTAMSAETANFCVEHGIAVKLPIQLDMKYEQFGIVTRNGYVKSPASHKMIELLRTYSNI